MRRCPHFNSFSKTFSSSIQPQEELTRRDTPTKQLTLSATEFPTLLPSTSNQTKVQKSKLVTSTTIEVLLQLRCGDLKTCAQMTKVLYFIAINIHVLDIEAKLRQFVTQVPQGQDAPKPQINVNMGYGSKGSRGQMAHTAHNSPFNNQ